MVLDKLFLICPYAIVAGGAPRDWYFGDVAKDIDVYFSTNAMTEKALLNQLQKAFATTVNVKFSRRTDTHTDPMYETLEGLVRIIELEVDGVPVQLIQMDTSQRLFKVVDNFSVSICKIWYKGGDIRRTTAFKLTEKTKIMFLSDKYNWTDPHPSKMKTRFSGKYIAGTLETAKNQAMNLFLNS